MDIPSVKRENRRKIKACLQLAKIIPKPKIRWWFKQQIFRKKSMDKTGTHQQKSEVHQTVDCSAIVQQLKQARMGFYPRGFGNRSSDYGFLTWIMRI